MRWGIFLSVVVVLACLVVPAAVSQPAWVAVSTEYDQYLDTDPEWPGFMDRQALRLDYATGWTWPGSIFFDPGPGILGVESGLDAFHYIATGDLRYFSTSGDINAGAYVFEDEDLLLWNGVVVTEVFDVKNLMLATGGPLGFDYGLDAVCYVEDDPRQGSYWAFSTEVDVLPLGVTSGDLIFTDGVNVTGTLLLQGAFDHEVGCDALHLSIREGGGYQVNMSTEVDGSVYDPDKGVWLPFKDEDVLTLMFDANKVLEEATLPENWSGVIAFGRDVGLDALYLAPEVPEPTTVLLVGLGIGALALRLRKKK
jgi:hypothetical protein